MRSLFISTLLVLFACGSVLSKHDTKLETAISPQPTPTAVPLGMVAYPADSLAPSDTVKFSKGDSIFIFDGELYYRARANGKEFFISQHQLLPKSDSLVIYQNYRLINKLSSNDDAADTASQKIIRQRCNAINKDGTRCKRLALPGQTKCWQHKAN